MDRSSKGAPQLQKARNPCTTQSNEIKTTRNYLFLLKAKWDFEVVR